MGSDLTKCAKVPLPPEGYYSCGKAVESICPKRDWSIKRENCGHCKQPVSFYELHENCRVCGKLCHTETCLHAYAVNYADENHNLVEEAKSYVCSRSSCIGSRYVGCKLCNSNVPASQCNSHTDKPGQCKNPVLVALDTLTKENAALKQQLSDNDVEELDERSLGSNVSSLSSGSRSVTFAEEPEESEDLPKKSNKLFKTRPSKVIIANRSNSDIICVVSTSAKYRISDVGVAAQTSGMKFSLKWVPADKKKPTIQTIKAHDSESFPCHSDCLYLTLCTRPKKTYYVHFEGVELKKGTRKNLLQKYLDAYSHTLTEEQYKKAI
jgi:hypothetical protein